MAHILVIEDYSDTRELTELILEEEGHTTICASDGLAGLACATQKHPDLILMDLNLPQLDGWEATRRLKTDPATRHIPVIAFTAYTAERDITDALEAGCIAVIAKPFEIDALLKQIAETLETQGS